MMETKVCIILLVSLFFPINGHVVMEITVLQYDNPLGTSYIKDNTDGNRKCCDTGGGSDCAGKADTCDVYFSFCVGSTHMLMGPCNGTSIDMSQNVTMDVDYIGQTNNGGLTRLATLPDWQPNVTTLAVDILDIDEINNNTKQPVIIPDQIDTFNTPLKFTPAKDYWSARAHVISLTNHVSIDLEVRLWCQEGYFGEACQHQCTADRYHECNEQGQRQAVQCTNPDALSLTFLGSLENRNIRSVIRRIPRFIADRVCPPDTKSVNVTIYHVTQMSGQSQINVVFWASCDYTPVSLLKLREMVFTLENIQTRLGSPEDFLGLRVVTPSITIANDGKTSSMESVIFMIRLMRYKGCAGCQLSIGASNQTLWSWDFSKHLDMRDCDGQLIDIQNNNVQGPGDWSTVLLRMMMFPLHLSGSVTSAAMQLVAKHTFATQNISLGRNFYDATPYRFDRSDVNGTTLQLEVIAWCGNCFHGNYCHVAYPVNSCNPDVPNLTSDCSANTDCANGATCTFHEICLCTNNWLGRRCKTDVNECSSGVCENAMSCTNTPGGYRCSCKPGFTGENCDIDINECTSSPCDSKHYCLNTFGSYKCTCRDFQNNANCIRPNPCEIQPCFNNGTCVLVQDTFKCNCQPGWTDALCYEDINECENNETCSYHGDCINTKGDYFCNCSVGWSGQTCSHDVDECASADSCSNHGKCLNKIGSYECNCMNGWQGTHCESDINECLHNQCQHNGKCHNFDGGYNCSCNFGWAGFNCSNDVNECSSKSICSNNGTCINTPGSFVCSCPDGWTGSTCSVDIDFCSVSPCQNSGTCVEMPSGYNCVCPIGWTGLNCSVHIDHCRSSVNPCQNGGTCHSIAGGFVCRCSVAFTGSDCSQELDRCLSLHCVNGAKCVNGKCICTSGWTGEDCSMDINECQSSAPCPTNTTCINYHGGYNCTSTGSSCDDHNCNSTYEECVALSLCLNNGTCLNATSGFICACSTLFTGNYCEGSIDPCYCENGGTCYISHNIYQCTCPSGWSGTKCSENVNECVENTNLCIHGDCVDTMGSYKCVCADGFTGPNCSQFINECTFTHPCENNGTCTSTQDGYKCICTSDWTGLRCSQHINKCLYKDICSMHGTCLNVEGILTCHCNTGWKGNNCSEDVDECVNMPCRQGSNCSNTIGSFHCVCKDGWSGTTCSTLLTSQATKVMWSSSTYDVPTTTKQTKSDVVEIYSIDFTSPVQDRDRPQLRRGIEQFLRFQLCRHSANVLVTLVRDSLSGPNTVEFEAFCDGQGLTSTDVYNSLHNISRSTLDSFFPTNLHIADSKPVKQATNNKSWLSDHETLVVGVTLGLVLLVVLVGGTIYLIKRSSARRMRNNDLILESRVIPNMEDIDNTTFSWNR